jgi:hypothetical protein
MVSEGRVITVEEQCRVEVVVEGLDVNSSCRAEN